MSDAQYRLLIQRSFDEELNKQEHRALIEHLESSESGAKFHHQLDQMIQAAQDTPLPDELRPQNPEALARMIMEQLPQKKGSVFGFLGNLFSGLSKGKSSAPAPQKQKVGKAPKAAPQKGKGRPGKPQDDEDMQEQEDSGSASRGPGMKFPRKGKELNADQIESQVGGFGRLKSIGNKAQELEDNRESQSTTRSLGEKFSMPWANQEGPNEGPLTLAESIKRKVTESQKLSPIDEDDMTGSQNDTSSSGFGRGSAPSSTGTEGWSAPISMPNQPAAPQADWAGGSGGGFAANSQPPNFAQQPGISQSGMGSMPKPQAPQPFGQQPAAFNKPDIGLADKGERGSAIGLAPQAKPEPIKAAPTSGTGTDWGGGWSGGGSNTEQSGWGNQAQPAPAPAPAPQAEAPKADWGSGWATPSDQRQPLKSSDSWAMPGSEGAGAWGAANNNNAEPEPQQAAPAPTPAPAPAAADPWGAPQAPAASMDGIGSMGSAGMGNMGSAGMAPSNSGVNMQAQQPAAPDWGQEPANDNAGWNQAANWGNEQVASAPAPVAPAPQPVAADPWAQAVPAQIPAPQAAQVPAQEANMGGWGAQPAAGGWNQAPAPAPAPVAEMPQQQAADPWAQPIAQAAVPPVEPIAPQPQAVQGGWGMPATSPQEALQQQAAKAPAQKRSWATAEPDLIETGTFRAFTPTMDNALGAKSKPAAAPGGFGGAQPAGLPQAGAAQDNRWDIPISERNKMPEAAQAAPAPVAPVQAQPADNRWDLPIQERVKMQQDGQQVVAAQAPQPISPVGMPGQPGGGIPVNQIVDKMDQVLAGGGQAQGQPSDDRWDVPIQERIKQGQGQPAMAPEPAPAQINNGWQAAPAPAPAPMPVSGWGEVAQPAQTSNSGWPQTAPTPVQQGAGWAQEAPAAPPAQAPAPSGWGAAAPAPAAAPAWNQAPAAPAPQAPQAHAEITDKAKGGGLFNINDSDIDNIFGGIGVKESVSQSVVNTGGGEAAPAPAPAPGGWGAPQMTPEPTPGQSSFAPPAGMPQPAPAPAPVAQANAANKGLFQLDDSQVDQIFNNIGVNEPSVPVGKPGEMAQPQAFAPPPQPAAAAPTGWANAAPVAQAPAPAAWPQGNAQAPAAWPQAAAEPAAQSWPAASPAPVPAAQPAGWSQAPAAPMPVPQAFAVDDKVMNRIFDEPQPAPGQSRDNMPVPKIEGIGRLDAGSDNSQDAGSGRIASIGKFLLDQKDLDKLGKLTNTDPAEGKMRILTLEASQDLQELLGQIGKLSGVVGSVIVGHDGLLIANTMPGDMDAESVGVWALGVYMNTQHVTSKMGHDKVHQVVSRTPRGYVVIADFGGGLLVTVTDGSETDLLIPLMRTITLLVN